MKKAFTLVELLVVIGIIAVLAGVLLGTFGSSKEAALSARCMSNMKNLSNAANSYALKTGYYPLALSCENTRVDISGGLAKAKNRYYEVPGWISWYSKGLYVDHAADSSQKGSCRTISLYSDNFEDVQYAFQNGGLFAYTAGNTSTYLCPEHKNKFPKANWSYFMNPNVSEAEYGQKIKIGARKVGAEHVLLFAEIPFQGPGTWFPSGAGGNTETDAAIQYDKEHIGCNHKSGKYWVAHLAFCDGHVEKLRASAGGKSSSGEKGQSENGNGSNLREATEWLCEGYDVSYSAGSYQKIEGVDNADKDGQAE